MKFLNLIIGFLFICLSLLSCKSTEIDYGDPRLTATVTTRSPNLSINKGLTQLGLGTNRDGILYVPQGYDSNTPMPLLVALHGAGGSSSYWKYYHSRAEERDMILLAIDSRLRTWDLILGGYGDDLQFLDQALKHVFLRCNIDPEYIALCGFSDGATYALSLGISNGDLFSYLIGFSPGYVLNVDPIIGKPKIYVSHGTRDSVLPISGSKFDIVPTFIDDGYEVMYNEFDGGHTVPSAISEAALDWFLGPIVVDPELTYQ